MYLLFLVVFLICGLCDSDEVDLGYSLRIGHAIDVFANYGDLCQVTQVVSADYEDEEDEEDPVEPFREKNLRVFANATSQEGGADGAIDMNVELCETFDDLLTSYFRSFHIEGTDKPWKAFMGDWILDEILRTMGLDHDAKQDGCCYVLVRMTKAQKSVTLGDLRGLCRDCPDFLDIYMYGYAPKGTSVILYRKPEYLHFQYTVTTEWPGGVYGSPTVNGSRAGGLIAACWATMMYVGRDRYVRMTDEIITTARYIEAELRKVEGLFIFGKPATSVVAFGSDRFDIFKMADALHKKGWSLNALQFPSGIHIAVTHAHTQGDVAQRFVADVRDAAAECLRTETGEPVKGKMAIYGVAQEISDRSLVSDITKHFLDSLYYLPKPEDLE